MESLEDIFGKKHETRDTNKNAQCSEQTSHDVWKRNMDIKISRLLKNWNFSDEVPEGSSRS
jgi:hypothetical protein